MTLRTITFDDTEWQVVPKRPTMKQVTVGAEHSSSDDHMIARGQAVAIYDDMLAAAPEPETCFCDEKGIGDPEKSCGDCPRDYGIPTVRANPEPPAQPRRPYGTDTMSEYGVIPECDGSEPPAQQQDEQLPPYSAWLHVLDEAMVVRHLGVADPDDDYITAKRKLHAMFDWEIDVATDPAIGGDRVRKQQPMTAYQILSEIPGIGWDETADGILPVVRAVEAFHGIGKEEPK